MDALKVRTLPASRAPLSIEAVFDPPTITLRCIGELDVSNVDLLEAFLNSAIRSSSPSLEVDLRGVEFMDSCTLNALLFARQELARRGRVLRVYARPATARLFEVVRLERLLNVSGVPAAPARATVAACGGR